MVDSGTWIAIVDDDPSVLNALTRSLRVRSLPSRAYRSAEELLPALNGPLPQCLILDLQMPGMTGLELLQQIKGRGLRIPAIVITAHSDDGVRRRCEAAGATAFLPKPWQNAMLFAAVDKAMKAGGH